MRSVSDKSCRENWNTHFVFSNVFLETCAVYEIMWKNTVERGSPQVTIWRMHTACWILKATDTHSEYVILTAFPVQQWLHEGASMLRYTYIACLVYISPLVHSTNHRVSKRYLFARFQASVAVWMRSSLFWDVLRRRVVSIYRRFGTNNWAHLQRCSYTVWSSKLGPVGCSETSITTPRSVPEERRSGN
jgi:hypothetical protein